MQMKLTCLYLLATMSMLLARKAVAQDDVMGVSISKGDSGPTADAPEGDDPRQWDLHLLG
ncbi:MAG: hypothetical protein WCE62_02795 [Polyangiales bacterium]